MAEEEYGEKQQRGTEKLVLLFMIEQPCSNLLARSKVKLREYIADMCLDSSFAYKMTCEAATNSCLACFSCFK